MGPFCMKLHMYQGYPFCQLCLPVARQKFQRAQTEQQRLHWRMACDTVREMQLQWRVSLDGAADAAGSIVSGVAVTAISSTMRFASSVATSVVSSLPERSPLAVEDAPPPDYSPLEQVDAPRTHSVVEASVPVADQPSDAVAPALPSTGDSLHTALTHVQSPANVWQGEPGSSAQTRPDQTQHMRMASRSSSPG